MHTYIISFENRTSLERLQEQCAERQVMSINILCLIQNIRLLYVYIFHIVLKGALVGTNQPDRQESDVGNEHQKNVLKAIHTKTLSKSKIPSK